MGPLNTETRLVAHSLEDIVQHGVRALFRRMHINRDWIIGLVGERGSGKSLSGANIAIRDFMMNVDPETGLTEPCWSNMQLRMDVKVDDETARFCGLEAGGEVSYASQVIDKQAFLALDERYKGGVLYFDEFNLEYGEARRSVANVNLLTDRAIQQLRKIQCGLIYTVLNEMYVDVRIRENTDVFIKCSDVAFKPENLRQGMPQGHVFEWMVYPMSQRVAGIGNTYADTKKPVGPIQVTLRDQWGMIDTYERQAQGRTRYTDAKELERVTITENPAARAEQDRWAWLDQRITQFFETHAGDGEVIELTKSQFARELGVSDESWPTVVKEVYKRLPNVDMLRGGGRSRPTRYVVPNRELPR